MMSYPKPPQELIDKWIVEYTYKILNGTYLQPNGEQKVDWYSVMEKYGEWCADAELEACLDWFKSFYKGESWMLRDLKTFREARRKPKDSFKVTVNGIPYTLTEEQQEQLNQIINPNA